MLVVCFPEFKGTTDLEDSFVEEEVGLTAQDFTLAHRLNTCVTDMEPESSERLRFS